MIIITVLYDNRTFIANDISKREGKYPIINH